MKNIVTGLGVAGLLAFAFAVILPEPLAIIMCGPLYKYCGWICC